jgi:hypothetical protein
MPNKRLADTSVTLQEGNGFPAILGTITGSAATSNSGTGTPFTIDAGDWLLLQPDTACYVGYGNTSAAALTAASATNGVRLDANEKFAPLLPPDAAFIAMTPVTGTTSLKVFTVK